MRLTVHQIYNYSGIVINGKLCRECVLYKDCKDYKCPVHKWKTELNERVNDEND